MKNFKFQFLALVQAVGGSVPEFLSTHPNHGNRIQRLQNDMPVAMQYFQAARGF